MTPVEMLQATKALISDPKHWHKGCMGRDATGNQTLHNDPNTVSFCALGALSKYCSTMNDPASFSAWQALMEATDCKHISRYNDAPERTHEEVMAWFDRAIMSLSNAPAQEQP